MWFRVHSLHPPVKTARKGLGPASTARLQCLWTTLWKTELADMFPGLYDDARAAQAVAYLLHLAGGRMGILKLTKLLYLSERRSYELYGEPLTGDSPYSLPKGPVLSTVYDRTKNAGNLNSTWRAWIRGRTGDELALARTINAPRDELTALSRADLQILATVWQEFGHLSGAQLVSHTHHACHEWSDPQGSSQKIDPDRLLRQVGMRREDAAKQLEHLRQSATLKDTKTRASSI